ESSLERITSLTCASAALVRITANGNLVKQFTFPVNISPDEILKASYKTESEFSFNNFDYKFILAEKESRTGIGNFNQLDQLLLNAVTKQISTAIESEYLSNQAIEKEKLEQELLVAATIQQRILPARLPQIKGYEIAGINIPSKEVGGDYFNCIELNDNKYAIIIADVAGKGISAALLVNTLDAALYSYLQFDIPLNEMAERLNKLIYKSSPSDKYITFFITILDSITGKLDLLNAGHNPIYMLRANGSLEKFDAGGVGLGMFDFGIPFSGQTSSIHKGDTLFFYTDGITEAMNKSEEEYSDERMISFLQDNYHLQSETFINDLVNDIKSHTNNHPQSDDITALILKKL
ncbi:MAG: PP2C family protein-serine/threonine phosphatase, partial [Ignavibacterium sp.]